MTAIFNIDIDYTEVNELILRLLTAVDISSLTTFMRDDVTEYFQRDIESRFNEEGDVKSGFWAPLTETTQRIREELGYGPSEPINRRTDEMFNFLMGPYQIIAGGSWVELQVPGDPPDPLTKRKMEVATMGTATNPNFPSSYTPPRPVLATSEGDLGNLLMALELHIIDRMIGSIII